MDTSSPVSPAPAARRRRRRRPLAMAAAVLALALGAGLAVAPGSAGADIRRCEDGSPPPCPEPPEPEPTPPPAPKPLWSANVTIADLSGLGFSRSVASYWFRAGSPRHITGGALMTWADAAQTRGTALVADPQGSLPAGNLRGFYLVEWGSRGPLCRSQPYTQVPASGRNAEVILAPRSVTAPDALVPVASRLVGPMDIGNDDVDLEISTADIDIVESHLQVTLRGHLSVDLQFPIPNLDASFTYITDVLLSESQSTDNVNELIAMSATPGTLEITGDGVTDDIELMLAPDMKPAFRSAVQTRSSAAVVSLVEANPLVGQLRAQGYVLSARKLVVNPTTGIEVWPSLCRFT